MDKNDVPQFRVVDPGSLDNEKKIEIFVHHLSGLMERAATLELPIALFNNEIMKCVVSQVSMNVLVSQGKFESFKIAMNSEDKEVMTDLFPEETVIEIHSLVLGVISRAFESFFADLNLDYSLKFVKSIEEFLQESKPEGGKN